MGSRLIKFTTTPETAQKKYDISKNKKRPTTMDYIDILFDDFIEMHGDRLFGDDRALITGIAAFDDIPVTVIGLVKGKNTNDNVKSHWGMPHPEGYRKALRAMKQADKFGRPIITFIDTPGAFPGIEAEERGQGEAIARNLLEMSKLGVPVISIFTGEGGSGGALGIACANRVLMLENATYSVISARGFASILWKDPEREREAVVKQRMTSTDLLQLGVIDAIIPEPAEGAHKDTVQTAAAIKLVLTHHLNILVKMSRSELAEDRYKKFRNIGFFVESD